MNAKKTLCLLIISVAFLIIPYTIAYTPENKLVATQVAFDLEAKVNSNLEIAIVVKNYLNISITDVKISLNLSTIPALSFTSCEFGVLEGENVTLNGTITTTDELGFTPVNVTYGFMTKNYLTFNVSKIVNGTKIAFKYNLTSTEEGEYTLPVLNIIYYDNWGDKNEYSTTRTLKIAFTPAEDELDPYLPNWRTEVEKTNPTILGLVLFGVPMIAAAIMSTISSIRFFPKK